MSLPMWKNQKLLELMLADSRTFLYEFEKEWAV